MKNNPHYPFDKVHSHQYTFVSNGKHPIKKVVDFTHTGNRKIINMAFGDLLQDGTIDDKANSNNGDLIMVLRTIIAILRMFTSQFPETEIFFVGSTGTRTRLYSRIVKNYHSEFSKEFVITALVEEEDGNTEMPYETGSRAIYAGFIIRRIA